MKVLSLIAGGILLLGANATVAQSTPPGHAQHHPAGKKTAAAKRCCCEREMREMMSMMHQMMKMHGGMKHESMNMPEQKGMPMPEAPQPSQDHAH